MDPYAPQTAKPDETKKPGKYGDMDELLGITPGTQADPLDTQVKRSLSGVGSINPEEHGKALQLAEKLQISPQSAAAALRGASPSQTRGATYDMDRLLGIAPATKAWLADPNNAAIGQDSVDRLVDFEYSLNEKAAPPGFLEDQGQSVAVGAFQLQRSWYWLEHLAGWSTEQEAASKLMTNQRDTQLAISQMSPEAQAYRQRLDEAQGMLGTLNAAFSDASGFIGLSLESFVSSLPGMALGGVGGLAGRGLVKAMGVAAGRLTPLLGARAGAAIGTYYGTKAIEVGSWMDTAIANQQQGREGPLTEEALLAALHDPELMRLASAEAERKGIGTSALEALSVLIAGRSLGRAKGFKAALKATAGEFLVQTGLEGAGEGTGRLYAYEGDLTKDPEFWKNVVLESALSTGQSAVEIGAGAIAEHWMGDIHKAAVAGSVNAAEAASAMAKGAQALNDHKAVSEAMEKWAALPIGERSAERGKDYITKSAARVGLTHVEIDRVEWADYWKAKGVSPVEALQDLLGDEAGDRAFRDGVTGVHRIPIADWIQGLAGSPDAEALNAKASFRAGFPSAEQTHAGMDAAQKGVEEAAKVLTERKQQLADAQAEMADIDKQLAAEEGEGGAQLMQEGEQPAAGATPEGEPPAGEAETQSEIERLKAELAAEKQAIEGRPTTQGEVEAEVRAMPVENERTLSLQRQIDELERPATEQPAEDDAVAAAQKRLASLQDQLAQAEINQDIERAAPRPPIEGVEPEDIATSQTDLIANLKHEIASAEADIADAQARAAERAADTSAIEARTEIDALGSAPAGTVEDVAAVAEQAAAAVEKTQKTDRIKALRAKRAALAATVAQLTGTEETPTEKLLQKYQAELTAAGRTEREAEVGSQILTALVNTFAVRYRPADLTVDAFREQLVRAIRVAQPSEEQKAGEVTLEEPGEEPFTGYWFINEELHKLPRNMREGGTHRSWAAQRGMDFRDLLEKGAAAVRVYRGEMAVDVGGMGSAALDRAQKAIERIMATSNESADMVSLTIGDRNYGRLPLGTFMGMRSLADLGRAARDILGPGGARLFQSDPKLLPAVNTWYFSFAQREVERMPANSRLQPAQWMKTLENKGVKKEELEWLGLQSWLEKAASGETHAATAVSSKEPKRKPGPVSREEVLDFIAANQIHVKEVLHGDTISRSSSAGDGVDFEDLETFPDPDDNPTGWRNARDSWIEARVDEEEADALREAVEEEFDRRIERARESALDDIETPYPRERDDPAVKPEVEEHEEEEPHRRWSVTWRDLGDDEDNVEYFATKDEADKRLEEILDETNEEDYYEWEVSYPDANSEFYATERAAESAASDASEPYYDRAYQEAERQLRDDLESELGDGVRESLRDYNREAFDEAWDEEVQRREDLEHEEEDEFDYEEATGRPSPLSEDGHPRIMTIEAATPDASVAEAIGREVRPFEGGRVFVGNVPVLIDGDPHDAMLVVDRTGLAITAFDTAGNRLRWERKFTGTQPGVYTEAEVEPLIRRTQIQPLIESMDRTDGEETPHAFFADVASAHDFATRRIQDARVLWEDAHPRPAPTQPAALPETTTPAQPLALTIPDAPTRALKFPAYVLPGGTKPRELLLTLALPPGRQATRFTASHWDTADVLAHVRFDSRTTADGKKLLFIQEIQSDWHQKGRAEGYRSEGGAHPDAPFKTTWPELAFKRVLRWAAENGYEQVGWTTGKMQAERYSLSRQIDALRYSKNADGTYRLEPIKGGSVVSVREPTDQLTAQQLEGLVGRELAAKITAGEGVRATVTRTQAEKRELLSDMGATDAYDAARFLAAIGERTVVGVRRVAAGARGSLTVVAGDMGSGLTRPGQRHVSPDEPSDYPFVIELSDGAVLTWFSTEENAEDVGARITRMQDALRTPAADVPDEQYTGPREITGLDLDVGGSGMRAFYDQMIPSVAKKLLKPWGVGVGTATLTIPQNAMRNNQQLSDTQQIQSVDITEPMRADVLAQGLRLMQEAQPGGPRGATNISGYGSDRIYTIGFFENANRSTFFHELGHTFLDIMGELAQDPNASPLLVADYNTALAFMGTNHADLTARMAEIAQIQQRSRLRERTAEETARLAELAAPLEKWAKGFENYLREGKAPSKGLARAFATLKGWLTRIYQALTGSGVELTPEVREVMDRMLATDEEILVAKQQDGGVPAFSTKPPEWTDEQWSGYQLAQQEALDVAREKLLRRLMAETSRAEKDIREDALEKIRKKVAREVEKTPAAKAFAALHGTGPDPAFKLDRASVVALYGEQHPNTKALSDMGALVDEGGTDVTHAAEAYHMSSGDAFAQAMLAMRSKDKMIEALARAQLATEHPELMNTPEAAKLAKQAVDNKEALDVQRAEYDLLVALVKAEASSRKDAFAALPSTKTLRLYARDTLSRVPVREVKAYVFDRQVKKHSRAAAEFYAQGKTQEATQAKLAEITNRELAAEATRIEEQAEKDARFLRKMNEGKTIAVLQKAGDSYVESMAALLAGYDLARKTGAAIDRKNALNAWIKGRQAEGRDPDIAPHLLDIQEEKNYRELTADQLSELREAAEQIHHMARFKDKLLTAKAEREYKARRDALVAGIQASGTYNPTPRRSKTKNEKRLAGIGMSYGTHRKIAFLARRMDAFKDLGVVLRTLIVPINKAQTDEETRLGVETERLAGLFGGLSDVHTSEFSKPQLVPGAVNDQGKATGLSVSHEDRLGIAGLWGRTEGRQRLLEVYSRAEIEAVLAMLTPEDVAYLNGQWAYHESFWDEIAAKWKRVRGVPPKQAVAVPYEVKAGKLTGGYWKIRYSDRGAHAQEIADQASLMRHGAATSAVTRSGYAKETAEEVTGRRIRTDLGVVFEVMQEIVHDLTHHEMLIDVERYLRDKTVQAAMDDFHGNEVFDQFESALEYIAAGDQGSVSRDQFARWIRSGITDAALTWNVMNSLVNLSGLAQSWNRIGLKYVGSGFSSWSGSNDAILGTVEWVFEQSQFMHNRPQNFHIAVKKMQRSLDQRGEPVWREYGYALQQMTQLVVDMPTWLGQYEKTMDEGGTHDDAVIAADQAVRDTQGSAQTVDLSAIQRGNNDWKRLFTVFYFYQNTTANLTDEAVGQYRMSDRDLARKGQLIVGMMILFTVPIIFKMVLNNLLRGEEPPPGESPKKRMKRLAKQVVGEHIASFFDLSLIGREFSNIFRGQTDYSGTAGTRLIGDTYALAAQIMQGEADQGLRRALLQVTGGLTGWPTPVINKMWDGIQAIHDRKARGLRIVTAPIFGAPVKARK